MLPAVAALLTAAGPAPGRTAVWVRVAGGRFPAGAPVRAGDTVDASVLDSAAAQVRQELVDRGWLRAGVSWDTTPEQNGVGVSFRLEPGRRARVARWRLAGASGLDLGRAGRALPRRGAAFTAGLAEQALAGLLGFCERSGFPLAQVEAGSLAESLDWVIPTLLVDEGPKVSVEFLAFTGRTLTRAAVLEKAAGFIPGRLYSPDGVRTWRRNLERTGWLRCDSQALAERAGRFGVRFWVAEQASNLVSAAVGYSGSEGFTGFARLRLLNLLNTGRRLEAGWRALSGQREYSLSYTEPWFLGSGVSLTGSASHATYDSVQSRTSFGAGGSVTAAGMEVGLETGWYRVTGGSAGAVQTTWAGTGVEYDGRDEFWFPSSGWRAGLRTEVGQRRVAAGASGAVGRVEAAGQVLVPVAHRVAWANSGHCRTVLSEMALEQPELYALGGAGSLRGLSEDAFRSPTVAWWNSELTYRLGRGAQAYPFFDAGTFRQGGGWRAAAAYGAGARWWTRPGRFELDYGVELGQSPLAGKVHMSFEGGL